MIAVRKIFSVTMIPTPIRHHVLLVVLLYCQHLIYKIRSCFYNPSLIDQDMLRDYYYVIYYGNSDCRSNIKSTLTTHDYNSNNDSGVVTGSVVGIKGYMSDVNYSVPHVNDDISCYSSYHPV